MLKVTTRNEGLGRSARRLTRRFVLPTLLSLSLLLGVPGATFGAEGATLLGTVLDSDGSPLKDVGVTIRGAEFEHSDTTDKKGRFKVSVPDAEARYEISFDRAGFPTYSEPLVFEKSGVHATEWKMNATPLGSPTDSMVALRAFNEGAAAHNDGDFDLALEKFATAVAEDPELAKAHGVIAGIHHAREEHEQALLAADRVLALEPDNVAARRIRYLAQLELGRDGASETLDRLAELDRSPQTAVLLFNDGVAAQRAGDPQRALARYELATRIDPTFVKAHSALAFLHMALKNYEAALASSERALELDPKEVRGTSVRYNTFIAMGRNDEARAMLETLQRIAPDAVAKAYFERGSMLFDDGLVDQAIPALEQALAADPQLAQGHFTLALCYMNRNRNEEARRHLETFLELAPDDPDADPARQLLEVLSRSD